MNYDLQAQLDYLKRLKANSVLVVLIIAGLIGVAVYARRRSRSQLKYRHQMHELFLTIEAWAEKSGIKAEVSETPLQLLQRLQQKYPELNSVLTQISLDYTRAAYQNKNTEVPVDQLRKSWKKASGPIQKSISEIGA